MNEIAKKLTVILNDMRGLYEAFKSILVEEQELISAERMVDLKDCVLRKEAAAGTIASMEEKRLDAVAKASVLMGKKDCIVKIDEIVAVVEVETGGALKKAKDELIEVLAKVRALNSINEQLLKDAVKYVKTAFDIFAGKENRMTGYAVNGMVKRQVAVKRNIVNMNA